MKKVPIEEIIEQTKIEPYDKSTAAWCQLLNKHRNATHQMLLDALINANQALELAVEHGTHFLKSGFCTETFGIMQESIEAASFVEVEE